MNAWQWSCGACELGFLTFDDTKEEPTYCPYCASKDLYQTYHYTATPTRDEGTDEEDDLG